MPDRPAIGIPPAQAKTNAQNVTLFRIYIVYRSVLSILLLLSLLNANTRELVGTLNPRLYLVVAWIFLATNLVLLALIRTRFVSSQAMLFTVFFLDILAITLLADSSGGMGSGLPILLVITAACSAILINSGTIATLIAALCVIAILADTIRLINEQVLEIPNLIPAGLLGILIFAVSLLIQLIARRVGKAEELARRRAADLLNLQRLNEQIVQHLQMGILLVQGNDGVRIMNQAATRLIDPERPAPLEQGMPLADYHPDLAEQFERWRNSGTHLPRPITVNDAAPQIVANFRALDDAGTGDTLVFIEDYSPVTQQAQSLKLASLGRLTASIAHEIRNPLGAVSHAAQLLQESDKATDDDRRMAEIIQNHAQRMNAIIESVMQISRRQPANPQPLSLKGWLQNFVDEYRYSHKEASDIRVDLPERSLEILFDPDHLGRILSNLLDNGLRHSRIATGNASVEIRVTWEQLSQRCLIDIVDQGLGVAPAEQAKLFEPFYTTVDKGTGLGLYLCKELCEINNATLTYRPTADGQSCFRMAIAQRG
jgi:two-component system sensor histidine kinase PilS (NtrC family)